MKHSEKMTTGERRVYVVSKGSIVTTYETTAGGLLVTKKNAKTGVKTKDMYRKMTMNSLLGECERYEGAHSMSNHMIIREFADVELSGREHIALSEIIQKKYKKNTKKP